MKLSAIVIVANVVWFFIPVVIHMAIVHHAARKLKNLRGHISPDKKRTPNTKKIVDVTKITITNSVYFVKYSLKTIVS